MDKTYGRRELLCLPIWQKGSGYFVEFIAFLTLSLASQRILCNFLQGHWSLRKNFFHCSILLYFKMRISQFFKQSVYESWGNVILQALICITLHHPTVLLIRPGCHTGAAYARTGLILQQKNCMISLSDTWAHSIIVRAKRHPIIIWDTCTCRPCHVIWYFDS